jgi:Undecaprenyl-phosphate galactose phosphotransferase WbaP
MVNLGIFVVVKLFLGSLAMKENVKTLDRVDLRAKFWGFISYRGSYRLRMGLLLVIADTLSFLVAGWLAVGVRIMFGEPWQFSLFIQTLPILVASLIFFGLAGLYPAVGMSQVEELKKLVTTATLVILSMTALSFWLRNAENFSRLTPTLTWLFAIIVLPVNRDIIRTVAVRLHLWGEPVALIGYGKQSQWVLEFFQKNEKLGLKPVVILDASGRASYPPPNIRVVKVNALYPKDGIDSLTDVKTALIVLSDVPAKFMTMISSNQKGGWERLILLPNLEQISSFGVMSFDFGGVLGLEVSHSLLNPFQQAVKRLLDIFIVIVGGIITSPILGFLVILLFFDTKGSVLYGHSRVGKGGKKFMAWKFRTMVKDADRKLQEYLDRYPDMRSEWESTHKLRSDPRVTPLGGILRRYSLDELPQLINVLKGEMSLVGPRPIVEDEVRHYGDLFDPYTWVRPGITGMWQVSGRSDTTYAQRVSLDEYYVRNWSIWLDLYILVRTVFVVLLRKGAY